ncbi:hypothetical protein DASC09_038100 [Saccharomycopsis crataegensis]|uniref:Uncharacterized protein n=1 Tax=Saccharomycopsis crataegensis TaxID=43959 RepID=A0AAV5QQ98_9ASCO|nr:hypothetical protein DASC09_038100 [Saccharomycopsis crataegensis]
MRLQRLESQPNKEPSQSFSLSNESTLVEQYSVLNDKLIDINPRIDKFSIKEPSDELPILNSVRKSKLSNNLIHSRKYKDALEILGIYYYNYQSILNFENSEICHSINPHLTFRQFLKIFEVFYFLASNPIIHGEYQETSDDTTGSLLDKNYRLSKLLSKFLINFLMSINSLFKFKFREDPISKGAKMTNFRQFDELFFKALLATLKNKRNIFNRKKSERNNGNRSLLGCHLKSTMMLRIYAQFLKSAMSCDPEFCGKLIFQMFVDNCVKLEYLVMIIIFHNSFPKEDRFKKSLHERPGDFKAIFKKHKQRHQPFFKIFKISFLQFTKSDSRHKILLLNFLDKYHFSIAAGDSTKVDPAGFEFVIMVMLEILKILIDCILENKLVTRLSNDDKTAALSFKQLRTFRRKLLAHLLVLNNAKILSSFNAIDWELFLDEKWKTC